MVIPDVLADDPRVKVVTDALTPTEQGQNGTHVEPVAVAHLARAIGGELYARYTHSRSFRNRLIRLVLVSVGSLGLMLTAFATNLIPLRVTRPALSSLEIGLLVSLFGTVEALITAVPPLARTPGRWDPFFLPYYQMLLKIALGPIFAIIGVMILEAGMIPNVGKDSISLADLLVWALAFGSAQQAVTRLVDARVPGPIQNDGTDRRRPR